jgi:hypothetical protein
VKIPAIATFVTLCVTFTSPLAWTGGRQGQEFDGFFWESLTPKERLVFTAGYVQGIGQMNEGIRLEMDALIELRRRSTDPKSADQFSEKDRRKYDFLAEYAKENRRHYEEHSHYFNIPHIQLVRGVDEIYKHNKNMTIRIKDAFALVRAQIQGTDEKELERRKVFMRMSEEEQLRYIRRKFDLSKEKANPRLGDR